MSRVYDDLQVQVAQAAAAAASPAFLIALTLRKAQELDTQIDALQATIDDAKVKLQQMEVSFNARMEGIVRAFQQVEIGLKAAADVSAAAEREDVRG